MTSDTSDRSEAHGAAFSLDAMQYAREQSWQAVQRIAAAIQPGLREGRAGELAAAILKDLGMVWSVPRCIALPRSAPRRWAGA